MRRHFAVRAVSLCVALGGVLRAPAVRAEAFYGPEIRSVARQSVDVMKLHEGILQSQMSTDAARPYFNFGLASSPALLVLNDGLEVDGAISRYGLSFGLGGGHPKTGTAAFLGMQADVIQTSDFPNAFAALDVVDAGVSQGVIYAGMASKGLEISGGAVFPTSGKGFSDQGAFLREGSSAAAAAAARPDGGHHPAFFAVVTTSSGVTFSGTVAELEDQAGRGLAALRSEWVSRQLVERLGLREKLGVPVVGLERYAAGADSFADSVDAFAAATGAGEAVAAAAPVRYFVPVRLDDLAGTRWQVRLVSEVVPRPSLRLAAVGWSGAHDAVDASFSLGTVSRDGGRSPSAQVGLGVVRENLSRMGRLRRVAGQTVEAKGLARVQFQYSYNCPDLPTFISLPRAHVLSLDVRRTW